MEKQYGVVMVELGLDMAVEWFDSIQEVRAELDPELLIEGLEYHIVEIYAETGDCCDVLPFFSNGDLTFTAEELIAELVA